MSVLSDAKLREIYNEACKPHQTVMAAIHAGLRAVADAAIAADRAARAEQVECGECGGTGDVSGEYPGVTCPACNGNGHATPPAAPVVPEPVSGDVLPPVGSRVWIRHGRDSAAHACTVTGYYAWRDLGGNQRLHRVFVRLVYDGTSTEQARMLCDCYATEADALAAAPAPSQDNGGAA